MIETKLFKNQDGTTSAWVYDLEKFPNGPIEVIEDYKAGEESTTYKVEKKSISKPKADNKPLPKTKQKYLNPETGKMVGYVRAKNLGII